MKEKDKDAHWGSHFDDRKGEIKDEARNEHCGRSNGDDGDDGNTEK